MDLIVSPTEFDRILKKHKLEGYKEAPLLKNPNFKGREVKLIKKIPCASQFFNLVGRIIALILSLGLAAINKSFRETLKVECKGYKAVRLISPPSFTPPPPVAPAQKEMEQPASQVTILEKTPAFTMIPSFEAQCDLAELECEKCNYEESKKLLEEAIKNNYPRALYILGKIARAHCENATAAKYFEEAYEGGFFQASYPIGSFYAQGVHYPQSFALAKEWNEKGASHNVPDAFAALGHMYEYGNGVNKAPKEALSYYLKGAQGGSSLAQYYLGDVYFSGLLNEPIDLDKAKKYFLEAADNKIPYAKAAFLVGVYYEQGTYGFERDLGKAFQYYLKAADFGEGEACYQLAQMYQKGTPVTPQDFEKYVEYLEKGVRFENELAIIDLAQYYIQKNLTQKAIELYEDALTWDLEIPLLKIRYAQLLISQKKPDNRARAIGLLEEASKYKIPEAFIELSKVYLEDNGNGDNLNVAINNLSFNTIHGDGEAALALGKYLNTLSESAKVRLSIYYFEMAFKNQTPFAQEELRKALCNYGQWLLKVKKDKINAFIDASQCLKRAWDLEHPDAQNLFYSAQFKLAKEYEKNPEQLQNALQIYQELEDANNVQVKVDLGKIYSRPPAEDLKKALQYFEEAFILNPEDKDVQKLLGQMHVKIGKLSLADRDKAKYHFFKALDLKIPYDTYLDDIFNIGLDYKMGRKGTRDYHKALEVFARLTLFDEYNRSFLHLGEMYLKSLGVEEDLDRAIRYLERVFEEEDEIDPIVIEAFLKKAHILLEDKYPIHAMEYLMKISLEPSASFLIGRLYSGEWDHPVDRKLAAQHFRKAALLGHAEAKAKYQEMGGHAQKIKFKKMKLRKSGIKLKSLIEAQREA